ncbi:hypothetical protein [Micromonospora yangpuensis]|uniref:hypothetical protein n=1 Tax=Micromonospora yangpuensis TaxID=683228 RepID=UPI000B818904|nr:hypothetical protein [Micromonospora yangpuensis]
MRHVIHLPVAVADLTEALGLAYTVTRSLGSVPGVDAAVPRSPPRTTRARSTGCRRGRCHGLRRGRPEPAAPGVDAAGATVSAEDDQSVQHWVYCDRPLSGRQRCLLRVDHLDPCAADPRPT